MAAPLRPHQISHIVKLYKSYIRKGITQKEAVDEIATLYDRSPDTIITLIRRLLTDTTDIAREYFKSSALKMAMTVVREGSVQQKIDILSRSNVGVLAPIKSVESGSRGFFLTVQADSCGAVKVGAAMIEGGAASPSEEESEDNSDIIDVLPAQPTPHKSLPEGIEVAEPTDPSILDSLGRRHPAKMGYDRGIGNSPTYRATVERAKARIAAARDKTGKV